MNLDNDHRGSKSPLVHRPTAPIDRQVPVPHTTPELETIMTF